MVFAGVRSPRASPSRIICQAARSLTEPPGLNHSALARIVTAGAMPAAAGSRARRKRGVLPIRSSRLLGPSAGGGSTPIARFRDWYVSMVVAIFPDLLGPRGREATKKGGAGRHPPRFTL